LECGQPDFFRAIYCFEKSQKHHLISYNLLMIVSGSHIRTNLKSEFLKWLLIIMGAIFTGRGPVWGYTPQNPACCWFTTLEAMPSR
jgi:endo-1,4-beta-mannosidase